MKTSFAPGQAVFRGRVSGDPGEKDDLALALQLFGKPLGLGATECQQVLLHGAGELVSGNVPAEDDDRDPLGIHLFDGRE